MKNSTDRRKLFIRGIFAPFFCLIMAIVAYSVLIKDNSSENQWVLFAVFVCGFALIHFLFELIEKKLGKI